MASKISFGAEQFLQRVNEYLSDEAAIHEFDSRLNTGPAVTIFPVPDKFYVFNSDAVFAFSDAIEDIALEEANGTVIASILDLSNLKEQRERYAQLAATMDDVRVAASGPGTKLPGINMLRAATSLKDCWSVIYAGKRIKVALLTQVKRPFKRIDDAEFIGFYTFNQKLISMAEHDFDKVVPENCPLLEQFKRLQKLDLAQKIIAETFCREEATLEDVFTEMRRGKNGNGKAASRQIQSAITRLEKAAAEAQSLISK